MQVFKDDFIPVPGFYVVTGAPIPGAPAGPRFQGDWLFKFALSECGRRACAYAELEDENGKLHEVVIVEDDDVDERVTFYKDLTRGRGTLFRQAAWIREELVERYADPSPFWGDKLPRRPWPAAGFVDTEIRCSTGLESGNATTDVQPRVQA